MMMKVNGGVPDEMKADILKLLGGCDLLAWSLENHVVEVPSMDIWRSFAATGEFTVTIRARRPQPKTAKPTEESWGPKSGTFTAHFDSDYSKPSGQRYVTTAAGTVDLRPPTDTSVGFEFPFGTPINPPELPADHPDAVKVSEECAECRGTGEYRGLVTVEKCGCCGGSGRRP